MKPRLISDLENDKRWVHNLVRASAFILLFILLDLTISLLMQTGIERFYGLKSDASVLMLGHSHLMLAVDKPQLEQETGLKVAKYTREGVNMADRKIMAEHYLNTCSKKPESVILSIDPWLFSGEGLSSNSWLLFLPFMDNKNVNDYIKTSSGSQFDYYRYKFIRTSRFNALLLNASIRGWLGRWDNLKIGIIDTLRYSDPESLLSFRPITFNTGLMNDFSSTLDFLKKENVRVILLNTPIWKPLIDAQRQEYDKSMFLIDSIAQKACPGAEIIDLVPEFSADTRLFFDPIHMNPEGQRVVTQEVGKYLVGSNKQ
jgi:hypothetical protein